MHSVCLRLSRQVGSDIIKASFWLAILLSAGPSVSFAHEGHVHEEAPPKLPVHVAPRAEATSENFELVAVVRGTDLVIYLDRFDSNAPVERATVEVETPDGPALATAEAGIYKVSGSWLARQDKIELAVSIAADGQTDILPLTLDLRRDAENPAHLSLRGRLAAFLQSRSLIAGFAGFAIGIGLMAATRRQWRRGSAIALSLALTLSAGQSWANRDHDHGAGTLAAAAATSERAQRLPDGTVFVPKPVQRIFGVRTTRVEVAAHRRVVELPGRIIADPGSSGLVQAAVGGRLSPPEGGFPRLGTAIKKGDVLAYVTPPLQAIDVSDMRQRQGELDQQIEIVSRRAARFERLAPTGAVPFAQLEEARLELQGLKDRRTALDRTRREPEALIAPVSGVIAEGTPVAGQMAQPNAVIFHIVDPQRLWVEALSFDPPGGAEVASAKAPSGRLLSLSYRGAGFANRGQTIPVHFAIEGDSSDLRAGQLVTVALQTDDKRHGIAVPRGSVVRSANGQDFVYSHIGAERFEARAVRVETLDGDSVLVVAGIEAGLRIVTQGAQLLDHVR